MSCRTFFFVAAVVAATSPAALAGDLAPCVCDPGDAAIPVMASLRVDGEQLANSPGALALCIRVR